MYKILVIDDSSTMCKMIQMVLKPLNIKIFEANNGIEGIEIINREKIDLVMTDLNMPEMNGFDFIRYMKQNENYINTPTIIISTEKKQESLDTAKELGVTQYIVKPFKLPELQQIIKQILNI